MSSDMPVMLLVGGKGERLRPLTDDRPKPLVEVASRPILAHILDHLISQKLNRFIFCTGYLSEKIAKFANDDYPSLDICCVDSGDVDIATRILDGWPADAERILVVYGDTLADVNVASRLEAHLQGEKPMSMVGYRLQLGYGLMTVDGEVVSDFVEKPFLEGLINIGFIILEESMKRRLSLCEKFEDFLLSSVEDGLVGVYEHAGRHATINNLAELYMVEESMQKEMGRKS